MQIIFKFDNYRPNEIPYAQPTYAPKIRATITKKAAPIGLGQLSPLAGNNRQPIHIRKKTKNKIIKRRCASSLFKQAVVTNRYTFTPHAKYRFKSLYFLP
jgi:hypothetical protein